MYTNGRMMDDTGLSYAALLGEAERKSPQLPGQLGRFLMDEVVRRSGERGLLVLAPGESLTPVVEEGLQRLLEFEHETEVVVLTDLDRSKLSEHPVTWISPDNSGDPDPFMLYYGDGPVYAIVTGREPSESGELRLFHTADRAVVEHLAFQVKRDLGIPLGA